MISPGHQEIFGFPSYVMVSFLIFFMPYIIFISFLETLCGIFFEKIKKKFQKDYLIYNSISIILIILYFFFYSKLFGTNTLYEMILFHSFCLTLFTLLSLVYFNSSARKIVIIFSLFFIFLISFSLTSFACKTTTFFCKENMCSAEAYYDNSGRCLKEVN